MEELIEKRLLHHLTEAQRLLAENGMEADADTLHEVQKRVSDSTWMPPFTTILDSELGWLKDKIDENPEEAKKEIQKLIS